MKIKYVVFVTVYCIDGLRKTTSANFGANYAAAKAYADREAARKLLRMLPDEE